MRGSVATLHSPEYARLLVELVAMRQRAGLSQRVLAQRIGRGHSWLGKSEVGERRLDVFELAQICQGCGEDFHQFLRRLGL